MGMGHAGGTEFQGKAGDTLRVGMERDWLLGDFWGIGNLEVVSEFPVMGF